MHTIKGGEKLTDQEELEKYRSDKAKRNKYLTEYQKEKYYRFVVLAKQEEKEIIQAQAKKKNLSVNAYVLDLIKKDIENNN